MTPPNIDLLPEERNAPNLKQKTKPRWGFWIIYIWKYIQMLSWGLPIPVQQDWQIEQLFI